MSWVELADRTDRCGEVPMSLVISSLKISYNTKKCIHERESKQSSWCKSDSFLCGILSAEFSPLPCVAALAVSISMGLSANT